MLHTTVRTLWEIQLCIYNPTISKQKQVHGQNSIITIALLIYNYHLISIYNDLENPHTILAQNLYAKKNSCTIMMNHVHPHVIEHSKDNHKTNNFKKSNTKQQKNSFNSKFKVWKLFDLFPMVSNKAVTLGVPPLACTPVEPHQCWLGVKYGQATWQHAGVYFPLRILVLYSGCSILWQYFSILVC